MVRNNFPSIVHSPGQAGTATTKIATADLMPIEVTWQMAMQRAVRTLDGLLNRLNLSRELLPGCDPDSPFPILVPLEYVARMTPGDPHDPLLLQVIARDQEAELHPGYQVDAVGDAACQNAPGLLHKYRSRVLLMANGMCAVHCRYCFRRHFPYGELPKGAQDWDASMAYIASDPSIDEVILSGGDPLSLGNARLNQLIDGIDRIPHIKRLRIHTRFPVVIPQRIDDGFQQCLESTRLQTWIVLHINHAREIDDPLVAAVKRLRRSDAIVLNQAVLLRGINDTLEAQVALSRSLIDAGILPYYLHQLDRVQGAAHFECDEALGHSLIEGMREQLPGYAVPRYVREEAGRPNKTLLR